MSGTAHYWAEAGKRGWDTKTCVPIGLEHLLDWISKNKSSIKSVVVNYDPQATPPEVRTYIVGGDDG